MTAETIAALLPLLKIDLGITTDAYNERLVNYLTSAAEMIKREGAALDNSIEAQQIVIMFAAWLWRRRDNGEGMPRMVRWALNNFIFSQKAKKTE